MNRITTRQFADSDDSVLESAEAAMHNDNAHIRAVPSGVVRQERSPVAAVNEPAATLELAVSAPAGDAKLVKQDNNHVGHPLADWCNVPATQTAETAEPMYPAPRDSFKLRFDEIKINFLARHAHESVKSILFVGASRGDGASTAAYNFAKTLAADLDVRVLFVNADLRTPPSVRADTASEASGLTGMASEDMRAMLPPSQENFQVLPSGRHVADPAVLFQSKRFETFLQQASEQFDYVVLDGPPLDEAPESIALSSKVDGVMLVIDAQNTRCRIALRAKKRIQDVGGRILGVVLNRRKFYVPGWLYKRI